MSRYYGGYPPYVPVAQKRAKAERKLKQLMKKNPNLKPINIEGTALARTWWGKAWNKNLERYADYSNRIGRGRSYVRHRAVLDLQIKPGHVNALVLGSATRPYKITIQIKAISKTAWANMKAACAGQFDSLPQLLNGKFPKALEEIFMAKGKGLFPTPEEIEFSCSCPDWASMCKHVAASLYGVGARLDQDPGLFFKLRQVNMDDLVSQAVADTTDQMLKQAQQKSARVLDDADLGDMFGIDMGDEAADDPPRAPSTQKQAPKKSTPKRKPRRAPKPRKTGAKRASSPKAKSKTRAAKSAKRLPKVAPKAAPRTKRADAKEKSALNDSDQVAAIIANSKKGVGVATLQRQTGFKKQKLYNIVFKLKKEGRIKSVKWGVYKGV